LSHREAGEKSRVRKRAGDDGKEKERDRRLHRFIRFVSLPPAHLLFFNYFMEHPPPRNPRHKIHPGGERERVGNYSVRLKKKR